MDPVVAVLIAFFVVNLVVLVHAVSAKASGAVVCALVSLALGATAVFLYVGAVLPEYPTLFEGGELEDPRAGDWIAIGFFGLCALALLAGAVRLAQLATVKKPSGHPAPHGAEAETHDGRTKSSPSGSGAAEPTDHVSSDPGSTVRLGAIVDVGGNREGRRP
jgi:hypothetical protein